MLDYATSLVVQVPYSNLVRVLIKVNDSDRWNRLKDAVMVFGGWTGENPSQHQHEVQSVSVDCMYLRGGAAGLALLRSDAQLQYIGALQLMSCHCLHRSNNSLLSAFALQQHITHQHVVIGSGFCKDRCHHAQVALSSVTIVQTFP